MLRKNPGFAVIAILTLALGISINSAVFSIIHAVLLRPLPVADGDRAVVVATVVQREVLERRGNSYLDYLDWRAHSTSFEEMVAVTDNDLTLTGLGQAEQVVTEFVSHNYFSFTGIAPVLGRTFLPQEEKPPISDPSVLISYAFWDRHFGKDQNIPGKIIRLNEQPFRIAGIMPEHFAGIDGETDAWVPFASLALIGEPALVDNRGTRHMDVLARLKSNVSVEQATGEISSIAKRLQKMYPDTNDGYDAIVIPLREEFFGETKPLLYTLLGAVLFVLLIACANVANLLVARASAREKEIALRTALGAGKERIIRQLLTESVILSLVGGIFGWILALFFVKLLVALNPVQLPAFVKVELNLPVLIFTFIVCASCGILMGLVPAFHASRRDLQDAIKQSATNTTASPLGRDVRSFLVISEVALAVLLLIGAGLLARSFLRIQQIPLGFAPEKRVTMRLSFPRVKYAEEKASQISNLLLERLESIPSVHSAALTSDIPLEGSASASIFSMEYPPQERGIRAYVHAVSPNFFEATGIALKTGRSFQPSDTKDSLPVAILSEKFVERYWKNENPIGKRLKFGRTPQAQRPWLTVIGVVPEVKHRTIVEDPESAPDDPEVYLPLSQRIDNNVGLIVRTEKEPADMIATIRAEIRAMDPDIAIYDETTLEDLVRNGTAASRFSAFLMIVFGLLALTLSAIGIYGVLTFHVTQRTREIGLRLALGATRLNVFKMILRRALLLTGIGLAIGLIAALGLSGLLTAQLYKISPNDPLIFSSIPFVLLVVALFAISVPAWRAMRVEPAMALRNE